MIHRSKISLNRILFPGLSLEEFFKSSSDMGLNKVELRNDLPGMGIIDPYSPEQVKDLTQKYHIRILSINALQKFNLAEVFLITKLLFFCKEKLQFNYQHNLLDLKKSLLQNRVDLYRHLAQIIDHEIRIEPDVCIADEKRLASGLSYYYVSILGLYNDSLGHSQFAFRGYVLRRPYYGCPHDCTGPLGLCTGRYVHVRGH